MKHVSELMTLKWNTEIQSRLFTSLVTKSAVLLFISTNDIFSFSGGCLWLWVAAVQLSPKQPLTSQHGRKTSCNVLHKEIKAPYHGICMLTNASAPMCSFSKQILKWIYQPRALFTRKFISMCHAGKGGRGWMMSALLHWLGTLSWLFTLCENQ